MIPEDDNKLKPSETTDDTSGSVTEKANASADKPAADSSETAAASAPESSDQKKNLLQSTGAFFASIWSAVQRGAKKVLKRKKKSSAPVEDDFEFFDEDFRDISGGISDDLPPVVVPDWDDLLSSPLGSDTSEVYDGTLTPEDELRIYATKNIPVVPDAVDPKQSVRPAEESFSHSADTANSADDRAVKKAETVRKMKKGLSIFWKIWTFVRVPIIIAATLFIVYTLLGKIVHKVYSNYLMPVDPTDATPIVVTIPQGSGASTIAKILYEACGEGEPGLISHKAVFKVYVDFIGKSSRLQAGTYVLSKNMSIPDIVDVICRGMPPREIIKIQITEGLTIESMAAKLVEKGVLSSPDHFLELCRTGESFIKDHPFISDIPADETGERPYVLEGFLFPDTYEIYADSTEETIIDKMLSRFEVVFGSVYRARAEELGMSMYEVVTLASILEKEARLKDDFSRVSAVFYNRMDRNMTLDSDATLEYVLHTGSLNLTDEQLATPSGYNTHNNRDLPLGPVSNPGDTALNAALYPNTEYMDEAYLFFCLMNPENGALVYAKTIEEHNQNVAKYSPLW